MGAILVHEFMSLDGVIDAPTWTFEYGFDPKMGEALGAVTERCRGILLGRKTYELFEEGWSSRTVEDDPGGHSSMTPLSTSFPGRSPLRRGGTQASSDHTTWT